jgi:hypothetical protein
MVESFVNPLQQQALQQGTTIQKSGEYINVPQGLPQEGLGIGSGQPLQQGFVQQQPLLQQQQGFGQGFTGTQQPMMQQGLTGQQGLWSNLTPFIEQIFMNVDRAVVRQKTVDQNLINRFGTQNLYVIDLANGQKLVAREKRNRPLSSLFSLADPFTIRIGFLGGNDYQDVLGLRRPRKTFLGGNSLKVMDMNKNLIGSITKKFSLTSRKFVISDMNNNALYTLKAGKTLGKGTFEIFNNRIDKKATVGEVRKEWNQDWWSGNQQWGNYGQQKQFGQPMQQQGLLGSQQQGFGNQQPIQQQGWTGQQGFGTQQPMQQGVQQPQQSSGGIGQTIKNVLHLGHSQQQQQQQPVQQQQGLIGQQQGFGTQQPMQQQGWTGQQQGLLGSQQQGLGQGFTGTQQPMMQQGLTGQQGYSEDTYAIQFPFNSLPAEKALILCSALLIDFVFFNEQQQ